MRSQDRLLIPDSNRAWKINGSVWIENGQILYQDSTGNERVLSTLQREIVEEVLTEVPDALKINFTTTFDYELIKVFRNGLRLRGGGNDYLETSSNSIQLVVPLETDEVLLADYTTKEI